MEAVSQFDPLALANALVSLVTAFVLGAMIGFERQVRQRTAGLRTNALVAVGAAIFVSLGDRLYAIHGGPQGAVHIVAYVVIRHRLSWCGRDHEGRRQRGGPEHRRDALGLRCRRRLCRRGAGG
jgi:hypothetical protein